jgi:hypothetical protein
MAYIMHQPSKLAHLVHMLAVDLDIVDGNWLIEDGDG